MHWLAAAQCTRSQQPQHSSPSSSLCTHPTSPGEGHPLSLQVVLQGALHCLQGLAALAEGLQPGGLGAAGQRVGPLPCPPHHVPQLLVHLVGGGESRQGVGDCDELDVCEDMCEQVSAGQCTAGCCCCCTLSSASCPCRLITICRQKHSLARQHTCANALLSAGSCLLMSAAANTGSRYTQARWQSSHASSVSLNSLRLPSSRSTSDLHIGGGVGVEGGYSTAEE